MIAVIDFEGRRHTHDIFNAGTVVQISKAFPDEKIIFCAHPDQIMSVKEVFDFAKYPSITLYEIDAQDQCVEDDWNKVLELAEWPTRIVTTSISNEKMKFVYHYIAENKDVRLVMLSHGETDSFVNLIPHDCQKAKFHLISWKLKGIYVSLCNYINQRKRHKNGIKQAKYAEEYVQIMEQFSKLDNVEFIFCSTGYQKYQDIIPKSVYEKIHAFYLPYVFSDENKNRNKLPTLTIGMTPTVFLDSDGYGLQVIRYVNKRLKSGKVNFLLFRSNGWGLKNTSTFSDLSFDRDNMNNYFKSCDFFLMPFHKDKYKTCCSGSFIDALNMNIPVLMYESNFFDDFETYDVGLRARSVEEMGELILKLVENHDKEQSPMFTDNIIKMKKIMEDSNIEKFRTLLK